MLQSRPETTHTVGNRWPDLRRVALVAVVLLTACGPSNPPPAQPQPTQPGQAQPPQATQPSQAQQQAPAAGGNLVFFSTQFAPVEEQAISFTP